MNEANTPTWPRRFAVATSSLYLVAATVQLSQGLGFNLATLVGFGAYVAIGNLILLRRSGNLVGAALASYGTLFAFGNAGLATADSFDAAGDLSAAAAVTIPTGMATSAGIWIVAAVWLLFPDGRLSTPLDRKLLIGSGIVAVITATLGVFAAPQALPETTRYTHPFVNDALANFLRSMHDGLVGGTFLFGYFVAARVVLRYRHGDPVERRQAGWIAVAAIFAITVLLGNAFLQPLGTDTRAFLLIDAVAIAAIPLGVGIAIFRYRLYNIDVIINRSVTFGSLAAFIGLVYIGIVVGVGGLVGDDAGFGLSIAASAFVAMAFQPVRRRVERWANRLVYGDKATPHEVLVRFSRRSAELTDQDLLARVPQMIVDGTGAATATLWTRSDDGFQAEASWPDAPSDRVLEPGPSFTDPTADHSVPITHDDELLGGISLINHRGDTLAPAETTLLTNLASGLGLSLRNASLTAQLRRQVAELESSRERVLTATDEARRALENDLDSGPQQKLVALKVMLGPIRKLAERSGAEKTAGLLTSLEVEAGEAIKAVRDFASGVYPPLLEAEGLAAAVIQQTRDSMPPVTVRGDTQARFPRDVEAAAYFSILEALQNTAKYADASNIVVRLASTDGVLTFSVDDDGDGFDADSISPGAGLVGMADRLDTVGGTISIDSTPGRGTTVSGTIPAQVLVAAV